MNIRDFEDWIDEITAFRGCECFMAGKVISGMQAQDGEYQFRVEGNDTYKVNVKIDEDGGILGSKCDCPYDHGPVCKHQVACYLKLVEIIDGKPYEEEEEDMEEKLRNRLEEMSKDELIEFIMHLSRDNMIMQGMDEIEEMAFHDDGMPMEVSDEEKKNIKKQYSELIAEIVAEHRGEDGIIESVRIGEFLSELDDVLENAGYTADTTLALDISFLVLDEAIRAFQYADDANGEVGAFVMKVVESILNILIHSADDSEILDQAVFEKMVSKIDDQIFDGWMDFKIALVQITANFAETLEYRDLLEGVIGRILDGEDQNELGDHYRGELLDVLFGLAEHFSDEEKMKTLIEENSEHDFLGE